MSGWRAGGRRSVGHAPDLKGRLGITLYGSYQPDAEKAFLERQRDFLRANGYGRARLVLDDPAEGDPLEVSKRSLRHSDVNLLFFTAAGMRLGVVRELAYVADDPYMRSKARDSVVFDQVADGRSSVPDLSQSDIRNGRIEWRKFKGEPDLRPALMAKAAVLVEHKKAELRDRPFV